MIKSAHIHGKRDIVHCTLVVGQGADTGFRLLSKQRAVSKGICDGGEEEGNTSQCREHIWSCQHRRKEATRTAVYLSSEETPIFQRKRPDANE